MAVEAPPQKCQKCGSEFPTPVVGTPMLYLRRAYCEPCAQREIARQEKQKQEEAQALIENRRDIALVEWGPPGRFWEATFETFRRELQPVAYEKALAVAKAGAGCGLLLVGPPGVGKTHLAAAIFNHDLAQWDASRSRRPPTRFTTESAILHAVRACYREGSEKAEEEVLADYSEKAQLLIIDDLAKYTPQDTSFRNRILFEIIDRRWSNELGLVATANHPLAQLTEMLGAPITDRLRDMGEVVLMAGKSQRGPR